MTQREKVLARKDKVSTTLSNMCLAVAVVILLSTVYFVTSLTPVSQTHTFMTAIAAVSILLHFVQYCFLYVVCELALSRDDSMYDPNSLAYAGTKFCFAAKLGMTVVLMLYMLSALR